MKITSAGSSDYENGSGYKFWDFLKNWDTLSEEEKLIKFNEFTCHEMNIFLYFKDDGFSKKYVIPFIQNKIEKSFVDVFLLNQKSLILDYYRHP